MFKTDTIRVIQQLVDTIHSRQDRSAFPNRGVVISLEATVMDYEISGYEDLDSRVSKQISILFTKNISVFYLPELYWQDPDQDYSKWINTSNHDSCWKTDGLQFLQDIYFEMCQKCNSSKAPISLYSELNFTFGSMWKMVNVETKPSMSNDWQREITNIEVIK